jgi:hypothetical protein
MNFNGFAVSIDGFYHDSPVILGAKTLEREDSKLPINGLTEIDRPPRQGMIRLGVKKKKQGTNTEYPSEVDFFILDPETPEPEEKKRLIDLFHKEFGSEPKAISCLIRSSDINEAFPQNYKRYGRNTALKCIGDGETALCTDPQFVEGLKALTDKELQEKELKKNPTRPIVWCAGRDCMYSIVNDASKNKECKATATLSIEIPVLGGIGCWQITTGSFNSILNINGFIRDMVLRFGRAHMLPLTLERREIETIFRGKKAKHYPLYLNTHHSMGEMLKQLKIAPERVLIETYAEQSGELPPPAEIMDAEGVEVPVEEKMPVEEECVQGHPNVVRKYEESLKEDIAEASPMTVDPEDAEINRMAAQDEVKETVGKAVDQQSKEFLDGLKEDGKVLDKPYNAEVEGEGYKKRPVDALPPETEKKEKPAPIQSPQNKLIDMPENFFEFMNKAKSMLKKAEKEDMYIDALHTYSVKGLSEVKDDKKKQEDIRVYVEALLEEEGVI